MGGASRYRCEPCGKSFIYDEALRQHKRDSAVHNVPCEPCNRTFDGEEALAQHLRDSPAHPQSFECEFCDRSFKSKQALEHHVQDSPRHNPFCEACNRSFGSKEALKQHMQNSPRHNSSCEACNRKFGSEALEQHLQNSLAHAAQSFDRGTGNRGSGGQVTLEQHVQGSSADSQSPDSSDCDQGFDGKEVPTQHQRGKINHQQDQETPLDAFFRSFSSFPYDPSLPPSTSYDLLRKHQGWHDDNFALVETWFGYQLALVDELHLWFGQEDDLTAWHALSRAIGVSPPPTTYDECEKVCLLPFPFLKSSWCNANRAA